MKKKLTLLASLTICCFILLPKGNSAQYLFPLSEFSSSNNIGQNKLNQSAGFTNYRNQLQVDRGDFDALLEKVRKDKTISVIVGLDMDITPEGFLDDNQTSIQRATIRDLQDQFISQLNAYQAEVLIRYKYVPFIVVKLDERGLNFLQTSPNVINVAEDEVGYPLLAESTQSIGMPAVWNSGFVGSGQTIAVLDTGVDRQHTFFQTNNMSRVISEACYSQPGVITGQSEITNFCAAVCPAGQTGCTGTGTGIPCNFSPTILGANGSSCAHGTHVAGIAAGNNSSFSGVARSGNLISIQVGHGFTQIFKDPDGNTTESRQIQIFESNIGRGLERVLELSNDLSLKIASVNLSIGIGVPSGTDCSASHSMLRQYVDMLKSKSIAVIAASGNNSYTNEILAPACIAPVVSVGSTKDTGGYPISTFSNNANNLDLFAPGELIYSSNSTPYTGHNNYVNMGGTSMAAPHVAGAWAVMKQQMPLASVDKIFFALKNTGLSITDSRPGANNRVKPRIRVDQAINYIKPRIFDFDGDGKTDASIYRQGTSGNNNQWWYRKSSDGGNVTLSFGTTNEKLVPADYTADGKTDMAFWKDSTGEWFVLNSDNFTFYSYPFGATGDIPAPGDFDGDGKADSAVFRPSTGVWYILRSSDLGYTIVSFGSQGDQPVVADYDGDQKADIAYFNPGSSQWWLLRSQAGVIAYTYGSMGDKTVQGDYTGDGKADVAIYRPGEGNWYILRSEDQSSYTINYGLSSDLVTPGDYDGDGKFDQAVFRPSNNTWFVNGSGSSVPAINFGQGGDVPLPNVYSVP